MSKGKRATSTITPRHSRRNSSKKFVINKKIFSFIFILIVLGILIYILPKFKKSDNDNIQDIKSSNIENIKTITGLDDVEILGIDIESRSSSSIFNIKVHNKSNNLINPSKVHFYAIDSEGKTIFGMPINIPELQINENKEVKVFCTDDISSAIDYKIVATISESN